LNAADLNDRSEVLLAALVNALEDDTPAVAEIIAGDVAWDACDCAGPQVYVRLVNIYPSSVFPGADGIRPRPGCAAGWAGTWEMGVIRCVPEVRAAEADPAWLVAQADQAVLATAACAASDTFTAEPFLADSIVGATSTVGPQGVCMSTLIQVIVELPGCCTAPTTVETLSVTTHPGSAGVGVN
jgi:hypothetical protein